MATAISKYGKMKKQREKKQLTQKRIGWREMKGAKIATNRLKSISIFHKTTTANIRERGNQRCNHFQRERESEKEPTRKRYLRVVT